MSETYSFSGKIKIDWEQFISDLNGIKTIRKLAQVKRGSRDFYWYSPILEEELANEFADLVVCPQNQEELKHCIKIAYQWDMPVVIRGGGTGNYGQAVPRCGGLVIDINAINQILEVGEDFVRVEMGCNIELLNNTLKEHGYELPVFPSTQNIATVGGFIAGGSAGIGTMNNGPLREKGNILDLTVMSMEEEPKSMVFEGEDTLLIHHAWGINGIITEITLRTIPSKDWMNCIASFDSYISAYAAGLAIAKDKAIDSKLLSVLDRRYRNYFTALDGFVEKGKALMITMVSQEEVSHLQGLIESNGGVLEFAKTNEEVRAVGLPHVYEFSYNHANLQVLKADKATTYLQVGFPLPLSVEKLEEVHPLVCEEVFQHHEFAVLNGEIVAFDVPAVRYTTKERLYEIIATYESCGCSVADPHINQIEAGSMHNTNYVHLAWKKRLDPKGLLNPGKSMMWEKVKHLSAEEIEALAV